MDETTKRRKAVSGVGRRLGATRRWLAGGVLGLTACSAHAVSYVVLDSGINPGRRSADPYFSVVTDSDALKEVFGDLHTNQLPVPPPPEVDFERSVIVVAILGQQPTAGYSLHVMRVSREGGTLRAELRIDRPPPGRVLATVVTQPYVMLLVDRFPGLDTVRFVGENQEVWQTLSLREDE